MLAPIPQLKKSEILWLFRHRCKHGHRYLNHYNCYLKEQQIEEKVGFIDIETSNLKANFGIIFSYCIKERGKRKYYEGLISKKDMVSGVLDKHVVENCIKDMCRFNRLVGHYSSRFDIPYIRTKALMMSIDFPQYGEIVQTDVWRLARNLLCLSSNRQAVVAETFFEKTKKTRIEPKHWIMALLGNEESLKYIAKHNRIDVQELEKNYEKLVVFAPRGNTSI